MQVGACTKASLCWVSSLQVRHAKRNTGRGEQQQNGGNGVDIDERRQAYRKTLLSFLATEMCEFGGVTLKLSGAIEKQPATRRD